MLQAARSQVIFCIRSASNRNEYQESSGGEGWPVGA
jgi:hypothetical protein